MNNVISKVYFSLPLAGAYTDSHLYTIKGVTLFEYLDKDTPDFGSSLLINNEYERDIQAERYTSFSKISYDFNCNATSTSNYVGSL